METARKLIESSVYESLEFYTSYIYKNGEAAEYLGIKLLEEPEKFVKGALINGSVKLFLYYNSTMDAREADAWEKVIYSILLLRDDSLKTWGKLNALRGACALYKAGFLNSLPTECLELLKSKTTYDDFYDRERRTLRGGYPTNYYQVALACAGLRELIGWDTTTESEEIAAKLIAIMEGYSQSGWMDEQPPFGRFDRYSVIMPAELADTLTLTGHNIPEFVLKNLKDAANLALSCANPNGDGILYGRSLSVHGDCAFLEIISTALRQRVIDKKDIPTAISYCGAILKNTFSFWFDKSRNSYNLWFDGRTTNNYRKERRLLEVNLDMAIHMLSTLENLEAANCADEPCDEPMPLNPHSFSKPEKTEFKNIMGHDMRVLYSFVRKGKLYQLPLIGAGKLSLNAAYLPFPTTAFLLEASPESHHPFLVPHFTTESGDTLLAAGFYSSISDEKIKEDGISGIKITAKGNMSRFIGDDTQPEESDIPFTAVYIFVNDVIRISYRVESELPLNCKCLYAYGDNACSVSFNGVIPEPVSVENDPDFFTPHGACKYCLNYEAAVSSLDIEIKLPD